MSMFILGFNDFIPSLKEGGFLARIKLSWILKSRGNKLMEGIMPTQDGMIEIVGHKDTDITIKKYPESDLISWDPKYWMEGSLLKLYIQRMIRELFEKEVEALLRKWR